MPPPLSLDTTMVRSAGIGSVGPTSRPELSCTNVRSPISATVRPRCASAAPIAVDTVPSIPATPRLERTLTPRCSDRPARCRAPGSTRPAPAGRPVAPRPPRPRRHAARWSAGGRPSWPRTASHACRCTSRAALDPVRVRLAGRDRAGARGLRVARHVRPARTRRQRVHRDRRIGQQRRHRPVQRRAAQHDHLLRTDQPQRERMQRVFCGRRRRLGDRRQMREVRVHARAVPGDDDGVRGQVDVERLVEASPAACTSTACRRDGPPARTARRARPASGTSGSRSGMSNCTGRRWPCEIPWRPPAPGTSPTATARSAMPYSRARSSARPRLMLARTWVPK